MLLVAACGGDAGPPASDAATVDSAGVFITTYTADRAALGAPDTVADPVFTIGELDGTGPHVFGSVTGVRLGADGRVVVLDGQAREIRAFEADGGFVTALGGPGSGPGEFRAPQLIEVSGDSVWVWDRAQTRITLLHVDEGLLSSVSLPAEGRLSRPHRLGERWIATLNTPGGAPEVTGTVAERRDTATLEVFDPLGAPLGPLTQVAAGEIVELVTQSGNMVQVRRGTALFARDAHFAVVGATIVGGANDRFELHWWSPEGEIKRIWRYPGLDRSIGEADLEAYRASFRDQFADNPAELRTHLGRFDIETLPTLQPAFNALLHDPSGLLWVREFAVDGPEHWLALSTDTGQVERWVVFPDRFRLTDIRDGLAVGTWRDDLDVAYVQGYTLDEG